MMIVQKDQKLMGRNNLQ